jgi:hypothetical protein
MNKSTFRGSASDLEVPDNCGMNMYIETGPTSDVIALEHNSVATDTWYHSGEINYDYVNGVAFKDTTPA